MSRRDEEVVKKREQLKADYRATFESDSGKRVLEDLERRCFIRTTTFKDFDPTTMVFNEGKRAVLLHIKTMMEVRKDGRR